MKRATLVQSLIGSALLTLLSACSTESPKPTETSPAAATASVLQPAPLPAHLRELSGNLLDVPANAEVEMALLAVDARGRPHALISDTRLRGTGNALPFKLRFNPEAFSHFQKVELRARVNHSGSLILRLPPRTISTAQTQALGDLTLVPAP